MWSQQENYKLQKLRVTFRVFHVYFLVYIISVFLFNGTYLLTPVPHLLLALCVSVCLSVPLSLCLFLCLDVCVSVRLHECLPFCRCIMGSLSLFLSSLRRAWFPRKKKCGYFALVRTFPRSNECISRHLPSSAATLWNFCLYLLAW